MSAFNPRAKGQELVHSCRALFRPTAADRERIQAALRARLGADVLPGELHNKQPVDSVSSFEVQASGAGVS